MVGEISASHALSKEVVEGVNQRTGGVPLFVEEVTRLLLERSEQGGVQAIPPTLQQSLAARLDRLGSAREIAQIGAVLGRDFGYALLREVAETNDPTLQASLDRLADADLLFVEGAPPQASYRFKHALIQDAAYDSLLKSRRQALHRRAAEVLRDDPERTAAEPEVIAHHFTQASLDELAIEWWGKAGDQALRRSAFQEAIAHLGKAIEMADKSAAGTVTPVTIPETTPRGRMKLQTNYAHAILWSKGFGADEAKAAFERSAALAARLGLPAEGLPALYGQWAWSILRGEISAARDIAERFLRETQAEGGAAEIGVAHRAVGWSCLYLGNLAEARRQLELALNSYDRDRDTEVRGKFGLDAGVVVTAFLAFASWHLGDLQRARQLIEAAIRLGNELGHIPSTATVLAVKMIFECARNDPVTVAADADSLLRIAQPRGMEPWTALVSVFLSWARGRQGDARRGANEFRKSLEEYTRLGNRLWVPSFMGLLSELEAAAGDAERALASISEGLATAQNGGQHYADAFLHRLRGDILLKRDPSNPASAEEAYKMAIAVANEHGARSYELIASLALAQLYQSTNRPVEAHAVLAPALEGFSPTPEMPEIAEAQALLAVLAETDEVKAETERRQRRQHLQISYGNALIAARGFGAAETTEAFARARDAAYGEKDAPERLAADFGLWMSSLVRGELSQMRAYAETFVRDVEARPVSPEAGAAHRVAGMTHWFAGEYREAREHLERALALFQPGRDDDLAFRFGLDAGVGAMMYLATTLWPLGDVERAISLVNAAEARSAGLVHAATRAYGKWHVVIFELMRGDLSRAALNAQDLSRLAHEYGLRVWRAWGVFLEGLSTAESGALGGGLEKMRRGAELLRQQHVLVCEALLKIALAEADARAGDVDRAISVLDEALATCERTGHRAFEAELHRTRGQMLLRRDPANFAEAEQALQAAVAVARQQGTRAFELRAALSLAKLYRSTGRLVEAHAVLAPALEGFSPTPEMPEVAEAQSLLVALAETDDVKTAEAQRQRRLHLQTAYGQAMMWAKGFSAEETRAAFSRATELTAKTDSFADRFAAGHFQWTFAFTRGELQSARELEASFLKEAEDTGRVVEVGVARRGLALACYQAADFVEARTHCERALEACDTENERETQERFQIATGPMVMSVLAVTMWQLGEVGRARELIEQANRRGSEHGHPPSMAHPLLWKSHLEILRGDAAAALSAAEALQGLSQEYGLPFYRTLAELNVAWARGRLHDAAAGAADLRRALADRIDQGVVHDVSFFEGLLAELEAETLGAEPALARIDEAMALARQVENRCNLPFLHLLRGKLLLERDPSNPAPAEEAFQTALEIAKQQGARSWGLRSALSLAKLYQSTARPVDAHAALAPALEGFKPTPEMPEIAEAQARLAALAELGEVNVAIGQRQRRVDLQTAYARAVSYSKGWGADETKAALERAGDLATRVDLPAERFSALGQAYWSLNRGEVRAARDMGERLLREAEADGRSSALSDAHRVLGMAFLFLGDLAKARSEFELALNSFDMQSDSEERENFLWDAGAACRASLAQASCYSGDLHRAHELIKEAIGAGSELGPLPSTAYVLAVKVIIAGHRNDLESVVTDAENLLKIGQHHEMDFYVTISRIYLSWARGRLGDARCGADELRNSLDTYATQGNRLGTPYFLGCHAELEAAAGDNERALVLIDEGLAMAHEDGQHVWDAFLHRLRGDIVLKRDPAHPAPAEIAYETAIAVAKRQGARGYELLASLALAKLYQSTNRAADAQAVLAPALEGFSPTPEMPEIAEAQSLLQCLQR
jgi:predicted ATPase